MRAIEELNMSESHSPPSETDFLSFEELIGFELPKIYVNFIRQVNGGHPELDSFNAGENGEWSVNNFFYIGEPHNSTESMQWNFINRWPGLPTSCVPIARDAGDNLFVLNFGKQANPEVWIWVHDRPSENLLKLCDDFESFINGLAINPGYI